MFALLLLCQIPLPPVMPVAFETRAAQAVLPDASAAVVPAAAGVRPQPAAYVAAPRPVQSCAGGVCYQPAAQGPRYQYQSRSSQPRRFVGRIFGRR
jgi:hypothetical protein